MVKPALDPLHLENLIRNAEHASEIACQLQMYQNQGDQSWGELVTYAVDHAHAEVRRIREYFESCAPRTAA